MRALQIISTLETNSIFAAHAVEESRRGQCVCCVCAAACLEHGPLPLLLFHVGMNDAGSQKVGRIKDYHKTLGAQMRNPHALVFISSVFQLKKRGKPETDAQCLSVPGYVDGAHALFWFFMTVFMTGLSVKIIIY